MAITQEVNIEMLEKLPDGNFKIKYPSTRAGNVSIVDAGNKFVATDVEGALNELFQNVSNGKQLIATAVTGKGVATSGGDTFSKMATNINAIVTDPSAGTTAVAGDLLAGKTAVSNKSRITGTMPNRGILNQNITTNNGQISLAAGYYTGGVIKAIFANLVAANIKKGINIGGVIGNYTPSATRIHVTIPDLVMSPNYTRVYAVNCPATSCAVTGNIINTAGNGSMLQFSGMLDPANNYWSTLVRDSSYSLSISSTTTGLNISVTWNTSLSGNRNISLVLQILHL